MTLAALTPLVTWWPLFFGLLVLTVKVICPRIVRRQTEPPAELVAVVKSWPPPKQRYPERSPWWNPAWDLEPEVWPNPKAWQRVGA